MSSPNAAATALRTHAAGALRADDAGSPVQITGWVHRTRNLGGIVFVDVRDSAGLLQATFDPRWTKQEVIDAAARLQSESVVLVRGEAALRPTEMRNPEMNTGDIEVRAAEFEVLASAETPAIPIARGKGERLAAEELRLRYRHLDLRRPELQRNIVLRHRLQQTARRFLDEHGFLEIETPILTKPTPEGARDYLVPSRVHPGEFYALPQSPQLYKQLLMISGLDRYFQIARCFRDEDLRADRQPEFTQIDIEASFVGPEDIQRIAEGLLAALFGAADAHVETPFRRMTYGDAMERFGTDRPDLRFALELFDATTGFAAADFPPVRSAIDIGGRVRGIRIPGGPPLSRKHLDEIEAIAKTAGATTLLRVKRTSAGLEGPAARFISEHGQEILGLDEGDLCLLVPGADNVTSIALDRIRQDIARRLELTAGSTPALVWITDFPLFTTQAGSGRLFAVHHPFTAPHPEDLENLESDPMRVRSLAYDIVMNGTELGGGSIRIHDASMQRRILHLLGFSYEEAAKRFGFLLEALASGAPPHGGIALGFDRIVMMLAGATSLRDVIAFPKTTAARALFEDAPATIPDEDLAELHLTLRSDRDG